MRIWIDIVNSPQVLFFRPIIAELESRGHDILITSRDFAQTVPLANHYGFRHMPIGHHGGQYWLNIIRRTFERALGLIRWVRTHFPIDLAISHNSYSQALATALLRLPFITLMDYEHQPLNHLCFRVAHCVIVPHVFPDDCLKKYGALNKAVKYPGLKEQVYLSDFSPSPDYLRNVGIPEQRVIAVVRPPGPWAPYHRFKNTLFDEVLSYLAFYPQSYIVFLPRVSAQAIDIRQLGYSNLWIPPSIMDGPNLIYYADLVISAGGTMNREAAILGTPAYTVFKGQLSAADRYLIQQGRMIQVSKAEDITKIRVEKRNGHAEIMADPSLVKRIVDLILGGKEL